MIYHCGHRGCDICGKRECGKTTVWPALGATNFLVCDSCNGLAVKFAYEAATRFGGTIIDLDKKCGKEPKP